MNKNLFITVLIALLFTPIISSYGENLLVDPSFEDLTELTVDSDPWRIIAFNNDPAYTEFTIEKRQAHTGEQYVTILNINTNHARITQRVGVESGKTYRLSCWTKVESVGTEAKGANITEEGIIEISPSITGTTDDWVYTEMYIRIGEGQDSIVVSVSLGGYYATNTGKASFDDVTLEQVTSVPEGAVLATKGDFIDKEKNQQPDKKQPVRIIKNPEPMNLAVIIAIILGIICVAYIIGRIIYINIKKKKKPEDEDKK